MTTIPTKKLLLCAVSALLLLGCDNAEDSGSDSSRADEHAGNILSLSGMGELKPTWAGSYLAARYAQQRFDWSRAESFLEQVQNKQPSNDGVARH